MPRILPRLLKKIIEQSALPKFSPDPASKARRKAKKTLHKRVPPAPSFYPKDHPRSILLSPGNPVVSPQDYVRHKTLPPIPYRPTNVNPAQNDPPRQMTDTEFGWWANPYLRMLASPSRRCVVTQRILPSDFLVRLVAVRPTPPQLHNAKSNNSRPILVPDGLLHPKYTRRTIGSGLYILCWRQMLPLLQRGFPYPKVPGCAPSPRLEERIAHLLRLRVVQEFELLAERLELAIRKKLAVSSVILRRLTREEWGTMRATGTLPYENAVAVLILPPVNKDKVTRQRPEGSMLTLPPMDEVSAKDLPPVSTMLPASLTSWSDDTPRPLPLLKIPLYNGISAFPSRSQRAALHSILLRIMGAEKSARALRGTRRPTSSPPTPAKSQSSKASHAFLLCSDASTRRGDPASVARALWRLRMYDGDGWLEDVNKS